MIDDVTRIELYIAVLRAMMATADKELQIKLSELIILMDKAKKLVGEIEEIMA